MILILAVNLIVENGISDTYLKNVLTKILKKVLTKNVAKSIQKEVFDFVMIVWQRKKQIVDNLILEDLSSSGQFVEYFKHFNSSKYMIFHNLFKSVL